MRNIKVLLVVASGLGASAQVPNHLYQRAACNRDNLFRCFIDQRYSIQAQDYCAGLEPFTVTVATSIATTTKTIETDITADAVVVTETSTTTVFTETVPTATSVVTVDPATVAKRQVAVNPPKCMTNGVTYPTSRITSACSCINVPASTISVTQVVSTATVTEINTIITTPFTTVTSWETVSTATSGGTLTVTVPPVGINRLINGDFETGDASGWKLSPESWSGTVVIWRVAQNSLGPLAYEITGSEGSLGTLSQVKPIYLEAGRYDIGFQAPPAKFPRNTDSWAHVSEFDIINPVKGTNITIRFGGSKAMASGGRIVIPVDGWFDVSDDVAGYNQVVMRFLTQPPGGSIDNIYLRKH
ncbi:carbohydrate binding domain-containing protein [Fusarium austroafricanum]|uniref:Carbohydrate binding domain-containing protein n=1 Tax=Fusarium austroafricanum TaxID=2364996 RepID=A0A8H4JKE4_9HYPO|nr:carbohydrate binding domain-containing protein [Fusarium austroafricanum]